MSRIGFLERDAWMTLGTSVVFSKLSKLLNQEDALGAPCLQRFRDYSGATKLARCRFRFGLTNWKPFYALMSALHLRALAGRGNAADRCNLLFLIVAFTVATPESSR
jgi:hypothetical protein